MDVTSYLLGKKSSGGGGTGGHDWTAIGYSGEPSFISQGYTYGVTIKNNWNSPTSMLSKYENDTNLIFMPLVDTSRVSNFQSAFSGCTNLIYIPELDLSSARTNASLDYMFEDCASLSQESIDNILQMCIKASRYKGIKSFDTLYPNAPEIIISRVQNSQYYSNFTGAGWSL